MEVAAAVSAMTQALTLAKKARELNERLKNVEMRSVLVDLTSALNDAREHAEDLRSENLRLRAQLRQSSEAKATEARKVSRTDVEHRGDGYYLREPREGYAPGPYCTPCFDTKGQLLLMVKEPPPFDTFGFKCGVCRTARAKR